MAGKRLSRVHLTSIHRAYDSSIVAEQKIVGPSLCAVGLNWRDSGCISPLDGDRPSVRSHQDWFSDSAVKSYRCLWEAGAERRRDGGLSTVSMSRPCGVVVSAHASLRDRKPAFLRVMAARVFSWSRVERANRSSRVTISTSPAPSAAIAFRSCARSVFARWPPRGRLSRTRPPSGQLPVLPRFGRRWRPSHSRISCRTYGGIFCKEKGRYTKGLGFLNNSYRLCEN
jgi:hypothetical protein